MATTSTAPYPWFKFYPKGIPHEINPEAYPSLMAMFEETVSKYPDKPAFMNMGKSLTYRELDRHSKAFAAYLQNIGLQKGDHIAIQMPNVMQFPVAMYGILRAGMAVVNTNPLYTPREMRQQFKDSQAKAIVIMANFAHNLELILSYTDIKHVIVTEMGDLLGFPKKQIVNAVVKYAKKLVPGYNLPNASSFSRAIAEGEQATYLRPDISSSDVAFIQYTGGTTGVAKGAVLTHRNLIANVESVNEWLKSAWPPETPMSEILLAAPLPLYHVFALTVNVLCGTKWGANNLLITNPRDMPAFIKELKKHKIHIFPGLNTLFNGLLRNEEFKTLDFSGLKVTVGGGMAVQRIVANRWEEATKCPIVEGYGLSETSPVLSVNPLNNYNRIGTIGLPVPSTEMRVLMDDGSWGKPNDVGEICANGPQVMKEYFNRPQETEEAFFKDKDGKWFKTGDIGYMDKDGFFEIVDRKKDMILVSGFNVYPNEVEEVAMQCPGVVEVVCIGIPDERSTEAVKLFVVKSEANPSVADILKICRENLTPYKVPKYVEFRAELPKSNVGKILRRPLRDEELAKAK